MRIGWFAKEDLPPPSQLGRRLHAPVGPGHLRDAVFVEQGTPLVVPVPSGRPVSQGFGKQSNRASRGRGDNHTGGLFGRVGNRLRQDKIALVATGDAAKAAVVRAGVGQVPSRHDKAVEDLVVAQRMVLARLRPGGGRRGTVVAMQGSSGHAVAQTQAVDPVEAEAIAQAEAQYGHDLRMVEQVNEGLAPVQKARAVGGGTKAVALCRRQVRVEQVVESGHLLDVEDVFEHQIALHIE